MDNEKARKDRTAARGVTRRDFLKLGGTGLAGAALLGVAGCGGGQGGGGSSSGGTLRGTFQQDPSSLDPAIAYDGQSWTLVHAMFVTLITFNRGADGFVPWAAKSVPRQESKGTRYVFDIRPGIKFTDGEPVDAAAFKYGLQRVLDPKTRSPLAGFYTNIVGAKDFQNNPNGDLKGVKVHSPTKIEFNLKKPDQTFLQTMAIPSASAVPKKAVKKYGQNFSSNAVGSGPFKLEQWKRGSKLVLVKNQNYFDKSTAVKLNKIDFDIGIDPHTGLLRVEQGNSDYMFDQIPASDYNSVKNNPQYKDYVHAEPINQVWYFYVNVTQKPFDDPKVREALQYAIDKKRIVQVLSGRGVVANQILPPRMPGYDKSVRDTPFDPKKARSILESAGYSKGDLSITFWDSNNDDQPKIDQVIQQNLSDVGIKASIQSVSYNEYLSKTMSGDTQAGVSGWAEDFPDPADFLDVLFNSSQIPANNLNHYSNPKVDRQLAEALTITDHNQRLEAYRNVQKEILADHPVVPLYFTIASYMVSPKVQGFRIPVWIPAIYAQWSLKG